MGTSHDCAVRGWHTLLCHAPGCDCWCHDPARRGPIIEAVAAEMTREHPPGRPPVKPWAVDDWPRDPRTGLRQCPTDAPTALPPP